MRILGIDPGSRATGYGVVERTPGGLRHCAHGTLRPPAGAPLAERLAHLHENLVAVIAAERPERAVVERVFVSANARSALVLGQARGVALAAAAAAGIAVDELTAQQIKQAVVGTGRADKGQVQQMVARLLGLAAPPAQDAADALAAAVCRAHQGPLAGLDVRARTRPHRSTRPLGPRVRRAR